MAGREELSRVVIADAGPLIALSRVSQLHLLRGLFDSLDITAQLAVMSDSGYRPGLRPDELMRRQTRRPRNCASARRACRSVCSVS